MRKIKDIAKFVGKVVLPTFLLSLATVKANAQKELVKMDSDTTTHIELGAEDLGSEHQKQALAAAFDTIPDAKRALASIERMIKVPGKEATPEELERYEADTEWIAFMRDGELTDPQKRLVCLFKLYMSAPREDDLEDGLEHKYRKMTDLFNLIEDGAWEIYDLDFTVSADSLINSVPVDDIKKKFSVGPYRQFNKERKSLKKLLADIEKGEYAFGEGRINMYFPDFDAKMESFNKVRDEISPVLNETDASFRDYVAAVKAYRKAVKDEMDQGSEEFKTLVEEVASRRESFEKKYADFLSLCEKLKPIAKELADTFTF